MKDYYNLYLKYKKKYIDLKKSEQLNQLGGRLIYGDIFIGNVKIINKDISILIIFNKKNIFDILNDKSKDYINEFYRVLKERKIVAIVSIVESLQNDCLVYVSAWSEEYRGLKRSLKYQQNLIFFTDLNDNFYSNKDGLKLMDMVNIINKLNEKYNFNKVACIGNSMGGYAVLYISKFFDSDKFRFISFNPITFKNSELVRDKKINYIGYVSNDDNKQALKDHFRQEKIPLSYERSEDITDLKYHLLNDKSKSIKILVSSISEARHSSKFYHSDLLAAGYLLGVSNITISFVNEHDHAVFKHLPISFGPDDRYDFYDIFFKESLDDILMSLNNIKFYANKNETLCKSVIENFNCSQNVEEKL